MSTYLTYFGVVIHWNWWKSSSVTVSVDPIYLRNVVNRRVVQTVTLSQESARPAFAVQKIILTSRNICITTKVRSSEKKISEFISLLIVRHWIPIMKRIKIVFLTAEKVEETSTINHLLYGSFHDKSVLSRMYIQISYITNIVFTCLFSLIDIYKLIIPVIQYILLFICFAYGTLKNVQIIDPAGRDELLWEG